MNRLDFIISVCEVDKGPSHLIKCPRNLYHVAAKYIHAPPTDK